jgi:hypothetical protein
VESAPFISLCATTVRPGLWGELARQFDHSRRQVDDARFAGLLLGLVLREDPDPTALSADLDVEDRLAAN